MTDAVEPKGARDALRQRLQAVAGILLEPGPAGPAVGSDPDPVTVMETAARQLQGRPDVQRVWLLLTAVTASFPRADLVRETHRRIGHMAPRDATIWLLRLAAAEMSVRDATSEIDLVTDRPVVDVDFSASNDLLTGIQRVVRSVVPRWLDAEPLALARWDESKMYAGLTPAQATRVGAPRTAASSAPERRLVPWGVPVLLPEVPFAGHGDRLSSLARYSPNVVRAIGYDCIPAVSAELVDEVEREKFGEYLEMVKFLDLVAGISNSAAAEFAGFNHALAAQGLRGPRVVACSLPTTATLPAATSAPTWTGRPEVLCVGTLDQRKNQVALVEAAEHLWREGLDFSLRLVGSLGGRSTELRELISTLQGSGRPLVREHPVTDVGLDAAYRSARVVVFPTLHEGFGLPVVEALSYGVPVITSDFGSTKEVGEGQGAVLVDPEDVALLAAELRSLLTDDARHARLVAEAGARAPRGWDDYAAELWKVLVS